MFFCCANDFDGDNSIIKICFTSKNAASEEPTVALTLVPIAIQKFNDRLTITLPNNELQCMQLTIFNNRGPGKKEGCILISSGNIVLLDVMVAEEQSTLAPIDTNDCEIVPDKILKIP